jgi:hypothetical protein
VYIVYLTDFIASVYWTSLQLCAEVTVTKR